MFYYYGAKHTTAGYYPPPQHRTVIEPFAGAAGYGIHHLLRGNIDRLILVEKDARVVALWRRLLDMTPEEAAALPIPEAGDETNDFFVMTTATSNGVAVSKRMTVTKRMPKLVKSQRDRVVAALPIIAGKVEIIEGTYELAPPVEATWFVDPPYQPHLDKETSTKTACPQGQGYAKGCRASDLDFTALAGWCRALPGQVLVVEQNAAGWLPFMPLLARVHDSQNRRKQEMLWTNGVVLEQPVLWADEATA